MTESLKTFLGMYYIAVLALIAVGITLWLTGHGTGDPYLSVGVLMALAPPVVIWLRQRFGRS